MEILPPVLVPGVNENSVDIYEDLDGGLPSNAGLWRLMKFFLCFV